MADDDEQYRRLIDRLVRSCREGQGQISARRFRVGVWNDNAFPGGAMDPAKGEDPDWMRSAREEMYREQHSINLLLDRASNEDREILADCWPKRLSEEFTRRWRRCTR